MSKSSFRFVLVSVTTTRKNKRKCILFNFREICGQKAVSLATSYTSMPVWRVRFMMSRNGRSVRYVHVGPLSWDFRNDDSLKEMRTSRNKICIGSAFRDLWT